ncbi:MAG: hypothetical protein IJ386_09615 [Clostridia bacterium]|nr:hypothetical protein [Clostridia bacterium]
MKNLKIRFGALVLALVMCFGILVSCGDKDGKGGAETTVANTNAPAVSGTPANTVNVDELYFEPNGDVTIEDLCAELELNEEDTRLFKLLCNGMTVAEIQTELETLEELGQSIYELIDMMKP